MKIFPCIVSCFLFFSIFSCVDDGSYTPKDPDGDDTTYTVTEPSDGSIADGVSGTMPAFMRYDATEHRQIAGVVTQSGIYDISVIKRIDLTFTSANWESQLEALASGDDELNAVLSYNNITLPYKVGVRYKGTIVSGDSSKRSFNISLDFEDDDQVLNGYNTLILNGADNDSSFLHEAVYRHCIQQYIPASQVNYVNLHINGVDYGLYINSQHMNASLIRQWFLSTTGSRWRAEPEETGEGTTAGLYGTGYSGLNYLGEDPAAYEPYYNLKNNPDKDEPLEDIIAVCRVLDQTEPDSMEAAIRDVLDLDRTLWFLACENIFTDEDGYVNKGGTDYFLWWDSETSRLTPLEYDGNDTFLEGNILWDPFYHVDDVRFPLLCKLLVVPSIRQRYLAHYRTILKETYNTDYLYGVIDTYSALIDSAVRVDPKKTATYSEFGTAVASMKSVVSQRSVFLNAHDSVNVNGLTISDVTCSAGGSDWVNPSDADTVIVTAAISGGGTTSVFLCAGTGMVGGFRRLQMFDNGQHGDEAAGDGVFTALINPQQTGTRVRFYIEAVRGNAARSRTYMPAGAEHDVYCYTVQ